MPLWILLIPYFGFLLVFTAFSLINLSHTINFRSGILSAAFISLAYVAGTILILFISAGMFVSVDWTQKISLPIGDISIQIPTNTLP